MYNTDVQNFATGLLPFSLRGSVKELLKVLASPFAVSVLRTLGTLLPPFRSHRPVFPDVGHTHSSHTSRYSNPISSISGSISGSSAALKLISGSASMLAISSLAALSFSSRLSIATACR